MHHLQIPNSYSSRAEVYIEIVPQIAAIVASESDLIANLANISAVLKEAFHFFWVGFYLHKSPGELVLGPFQGSLACTRIALGKGVCGTAAQKQQSIIVPDVTQFEGHIACSSLSRSEIVIPLVKEGQTILVLDIDSDKLNDFDESDAHFLTQIVSLLAL